MHAYCQGWNILLGLNIPSESLSWPAPILCTTSWVSIWFAISRPPLYSTLFYHTRLSDSIWSRTLQVSFTLSIRERPACFNFSVVIRRQIRRTRQFFCILQYWKNSLTLYELGSWLWAGNGNRTHDIQLGKLTFCLWTIPAKSSLWLLLLTLRGINVNAIMSFNRRLFYLNSS